jgi:flagellin
MALVVNTNLFSLNSQRALMSSESDLKVSMARLSSGLRINSAKDDAAGLYTVETMTADIRGQNQAIRNAADGISLAQVAEGALGQVANNLQRIREIAVQAANGTTENTEGLQAEVDQLTQEISRIIDGTKFNGKQLLSSGASAITFQVGENADQISQIKVDGVVSTGISAYASGLTATGTVSLDSAGVTGTGGILARLDADIEKIAKSRATFGAVQNRFEAVIANLSVSVENLSASRSRIQDADFAAETAKLTRAQILQQAGVAMLAQANAVPQAALALLR